MVDEFIPTLTHATERDIDLLLVEELYASPTFVKWMAAKAALGGDVGKSVVLHSKRRTRNRREIDIFVELDHSNGDRSALLIENKLSEDEQPDQAESYREELAWISKDFTRATMMIVCPAAYDRKNQAFTGKFDVMVTYEELSGYFDARSRAVKGESAARMMFRRDILNQAIFKQRRGHTPIPNEIVGDFNACYVALLEEIAPSIRPGKAMLLPANPDESTSMIFDHSKSLGALPPEFRPTRFAHELGPVDNQGSFATQRDKLVEGIRRAEMLRGWLLANVPTLQAWKTIVDDHRRQ